MGNGSEQKNSTCRAYNPWITGFRCTNWKPSQLCSERTLINPLHITVPLVGVTKEKMNPFSSGTKNADSHLQMVEALTHQPKFAPFVGGCNTFPTVFGTVSLLLRRLFIAFNLSPAWKFQSDVRAGNFQWME